MGTIWMFCGFVDCYNPSDRLANAIIEGEDFQAIRCVAVFADLYLPPICKTLCKFVLKLIGRSWTDKQILSNEWRVYSPWDWQEKGVNYRDDEVQKQPSQTSSARKSACHLIWCLFWFFQSQILPVWRHTTVNLIAKRVYENLVD